MFGEVAQLRFVPSLPITEGSRRGLSLKHSVRKALAGFLISQFKMAGKQVGARTFIVLGMRHIWNCCIHKTGLLNGLF